jgi:hypothetical protein
MPGSLLEVAHTTMKRSKAGMVNLSREALGLVLLIVLLAVRLMRLERIMIRFMHCSSKMPLCALAGVIIFLLACGNTHNEGDKAARASDNNHGSVKREDPVGVGVAYFESNPLAILKFGDREIPEDAQIDRCFHLAIAVEDHKAGDLFDFHIVIRNECTKGVAVLTAPVETYVRLNRDDFFVEPTITIPVYAILYIFNAELGFNQDAFLGEGGREVMRPPGYVTLPAHSLKKVEISNGSLPLNLPAGVYGARFVTLAAPTKQASKESGFIDLGENVDRYNSGTKEIRPFARHPQAREFAATTFFKVLEKYAI